MDHVENVFAVAHVTKMNRGLQYKLDPNLVSVGVRGSGDHS